MVWRPTSGQRPASKRHRTGTHTRLSPPCTHACAVPCVRLPCCLCQVVEAIVEVTSVDSGGYLMPARPSGKPTGSKGGRGWLRRTSAQSSAQRRSSNEADVTEGELDLPLANGAAVRHLPPSWMRYPLRTVDTAPPPLPHLSLPPHVHAPPNPGPSRSVTFSSALENTVCDVCDEVRTDAPPAPTAATRIYIRTNHTGTTPLIAPQKREGLVCACLRKAHRLMQQIFAIHRERGTKDFVDFSRGGESTFFHSPTLFWGQAHFVLFSDVPWCMDSCVRCPGIVGELYGNSQLAITFYR